MKRNILYGLIILLLYAGLYVWYLFAKDRGGMEDLGVIVSIVYIVIPVISVIGGIIQRLFIKNIIVFTVINYIMNYLLLYIISDSAGNVFIISLAYAGISIVVSYITKGILIIRKRK